MVRYSYEDGKTAFIINEVPRAVLRDVVKQKIGDPQPFIEAFESQKYEGFESKFPDDFFKIVYKRRFKEIIMEASNVPVTTKLQSLQMRDKISTLMPSEFKNQVALFGNFKSNLWNEFESKLEVQMKITLKILSYAFPFHKARILLKRISRSGYIIANVPISTRYPSEGEEAMF